jgi:hypothetical protein
LLSQKIFSEEQEYGARRSKKISGEEDEGTAVRKVNAILSGR